MDCSSAKKSILHYKAIVLILILLIMCQLMICPGLVYGSTIVNSGTCGNNLTWQLDSEGVLTISGTGDMKDFDFGASPWFSDRSSVNRIVLNNGVTGIGSYAFLGCNAASATIPSTMKRIGEGAFSQCFKLTGIAIPGGVKAIGSRAFYRCTGLTTVTLDEGLTNIGQSAFMACSSLSSVILPNGLVSIGESAFAYCDSLKKINFPDGLNDIGNYAFSFCKGLSSIDIPKTVSDIGTDAFSNCTGLVCISVAEGNPFYDSRDNCSALIETETNTLLAGCCTSSVPDGVECIANGAFQNCSMLTSINLPSSLSSIESYAFAGCTNLSSISIPAGVTSIGEKVFMGCSSLSRMSVSEDNPIYDSRDGCNAILETGTDKLICGCKDTIIPYGTKIIGPSAFEYCGGLENIVIPEGVTEIGDNAFELAYNLISVTVPASVSSFGEYCFPHNDPQVIIYTTPGSYVSSYQPQYCTIKYLCSSGTAYDILITEDPIRMVVGTSRRVGFYRYPYGATDAITFSSDNSEIAAIDYSGRVTAKELGTTTLTIKSRDVQKSVTVNVIKSLEITRIAGKNRFITAIIAAKSFREKEGLSVFDSIVVASGADFPDALSASYLAYRKNGPILLVSGSTITMVTDYINANLAPGGTVYIVGGEKAVPNEVENCIKGTVKRLAGKNRYDTNLEVLKEAGMVFDETENVVVACGSNFADALSASALGEPILLVGKALTDNQINYLTTFMPGTDDITTSSFRFSIIGGTVAIPMTVEDQLRPFGPVERVYGKNRYLTSVAVADHFFEDGVDTVVMANGNNFPDGLSGGPIAMLYGAPLILVADNANDHARTYFSDNGAFRLIIMGGKGVISETTVGNVTNS